jgi:PilZ domain
MSHNRRRSERHPVGFYVEQFVNDEAHRCFTTDLSYVGLYMERLVEPMDRCSKVVQLEITLPETSDSIWAAGEVVYDRIDSLFHGTAIRFTGMARTHQRWIREWLRETSRDKQMTKLHPLRRAEQVRVLRPSHALA